MIYTITRVSLDGEDASQHRYPVVAAMLTAASEMVIESEHAVQLSLDGPGVGVSVEAGDSLRVSMLIVADELALESDELAVRSFIGDLFQRY